MLDNSTKTIPKGWKTYILKNEVQFLKGIGLSKNMVADNGRNKCVLYGELYTKYNESIKNVVSSTNSSEGTKSKAGDVLMPGSTTTKGIDLANAVAINEDNVLLGGDIIIIRDKNKIFNNYYFAHYLTHIRKKDIEKLTQGTTIIHLYPRSLENLEIILPPINEQNKIAEILSKVDEDIDRTEEIIKKTEKLKKGLMQDFFDKKNNTNLENIRIGDFGDIITGNTPSTSNREYYGKDFLWVSPKDIGQSKYIVDTEKKLSIFGFEKTRKLPSGAVLMVCIGSTIGKIAIASKEMSTNQQINSIIVDKKFDNEYIYYCLLYNKNKIIENRSTQAVPILNKTSFSNILIDVTNNKTDQKYISDILSSIDDKIEINKQIKNKLIQLKKSLMNDLLGGRVRV
jgi:type I restriction enzyme S subunit